MNDDKALIRVCLRISTTAEGDTSLTTMANQIAAEVLAYVQERYDVTEYSFGPHAWLNIEKKGPRK